MMNHCLRKPQMTKISYLTCAGNFDRGFPRFGSKPKYLHDIINNQLKSWRGFLRYQFKNKQIRIPQILFNHAEGEIELSS